jgi:hypothetical protein
LKRESKTIKIKGEIFHVHGLEDSTLLEGKFFPNWHINLPQFQQNPIEHLSVCATITKYYRKIVYEQQKTVSYSSRA